MAFVRKGIRYSHSRGRFTITRTGIYVVYSRLVFFGQTPQATRRKRHEGNSQTTVLFVQRILREKLHIEGAEPEVLITDSEAKNCLLGPYSAIPCYTSTMYSQLRLRQGDELFVQTLNTNRIKADLESSYFGVYRVT